MKNHAAKVFQHAGSVGVSTLNDIQYRLLRQTVREIRPLNQTGGSRSAQDQLGYAVSLMSGHVPHSDGSARGMA
ncbi:hypothetical protein SDC9_196192 [bioreactor metagenome]|uniref:Uncharacterized protein n=1 Tax=bioreactor metagenome TaxID=1076179 RepID=A0A645ICN0_9ZZZZ